MTEILREIVHVPVGSHCISFYASREEAADQAVEFLAGSPAGQAASYWVGDDRLKQTYREKLLLRAPDRYGSVKVLETGQVRPVDGKLRPVDEVQAFVTAHPEGVTAGGDTITQHWSAETVPDYLEYEAWFDERPRESSRFLCPYDLRRVPGDDAPETLRKLGARHSHVVLSSSPDPAVRLLQLFLFPTPADLPPELLGTLDWAEGKGLIGSVDPSEEISLTDAGTEVVREWSRVARIDW